MGGGEGGRRREKGRERERGREGEREEEEGEGGKEEEVGGREKTCETTSSKIPSNQLSIISLPGGMWFPAGCPRHYTCHQSPY